MFWIFKYIVGALLIIRIEILILFWGLIGFFVDYYLCIVSVLSIHVEKYHPVNNHTNIPLTTSYDLI